LKSGVRRVSASIDPGLIEEFDAIIAEVGYNRSTAIETAMRDFLAGYKWSAAEEGVVAGAVTMIYDHHVRGLGESLTHIQHDYLDVVSSATHVHLDHDNCLEILAVKGEIQRIKELTQSLRVIRGVKQLKFSILNIQ
jgi:CopG family transcriptional regulator, nickel-responsive regulator